MTEITAIIDQATGALTMEGIGPAEAEKLAGDLLGRGQGVNCGRPLGTYRTITLSGLSDMLGEAMGGTIRVARIYHGAVAEGPGRRSVLQMQGCSIRCPGCYVPETHPAGGVVMRMSECVQLLLASEGEPRDGVTILGGEPTDQPMALANLLHWLNRAGVHATLYSGHTHEELLAMPEPIPNCLTRVDLLIDGPYRRDLTEGVGEWRGSSNQRIIHLK